MEAVADEYRERKRNNAFLLVASSRGFTADVESLLQRGADIGIKDKKGLTPLHFAAGRGWSEIAQLLWSKAADVDAESLDGSTPLHLAALNGREDVVRFLLSKNALVNVEDAEDNSPLHNAARGGNAAVAQLLLDAGAQRDARNKMGLTPGVSALLNGHTDVASMLIKKHLDGASNGLTALHIVACAGRSGSIQFILDNFTNDIDVNDNKNSDHMTPLHCAVMSGDPESCKVLVTAGADVSIKDGKGRTPFDCYSTTIQDEVRDTIYKLLFPSKTSSLSLSSSTRTTDLVKNPSTPSSAGDDDEHHQKVAQGRYYASFLALSREEKIRKIRKWSATFIPIAQLKEDALRDFPEDKKKVLVSHIQRASQLQRTIEIHKAMASLREDGEFQSDMARSEVMNAVTALRKDPKLYESLSADARVASVVAKMGRIHAAIQANGQKTFAIEDLIVGDSKELIKQRKNQDEATLKALVRELRSVELAAAAMFETPEQHRSTKTTSEEGEEEEEEEEDDDEKEKENDIYKSNVFNETGGTRPRQRTRSVRWSLSTLTTSQWRWMVAWGMVIAWIVSVVWRMSNRVVRTDTGSDTCGMRSEV